jgi:WD40 repeat protein
VSIPLRPPPPMAEDAAMEFSPRIFISYSRADGRAFAEAFERRLEGAGIKSWRDLKSMEGDDIRPQVLNAIENVEHFVLILSRRALDSNWVEREWRQARLLGRKVSPVLADRCIKRSDLPRWIRRAEIFDIAEPERWRKLVHVLEGPGNARRVSFWSGDLPSSFVPRPIKYAELKEAVLSESTGTAGGKTVGLVGAGGYGKTTLANALCRDQDVGFEFDDGILRIEVGRERADVTSLIVALIGQLDPHGERPAFQDVQPASEHLAQLVGEARLLLVIDDVWREAQLRPFLRGGPNCVRLVTTRVSQVFQGSSYTAIDVDEMLKEEAVDLLSVGLSGAGGSTVRHRLPTLAKRLGYWAQMLDITNGWIRGWISDGGRLREAVDEFEKRLDDGGLTAFDPDEAQDETLGGETLRNRAIRICVEASLKDETPDNLARFCELAVLPAGEDVPLSAVEALWSETGKLKGTRSVDLVQRFHSRSLVQRLNLDLGARTVRLHDNVLWYLRDRIGPGGCRSAHAAMVRAIGSACARKWETLPPSDVYGWRFLIRHLRGASQDAKADRLLTDYVWIRAKLRVVGARDLFDSYLPERWGAASAQPRPRRGRSPSPGAGAQLIGHAIALSLPALASNPQELPRQIYGRLGTSEHSAVRAIVAASRLDPDIRPAPRWPGLTSPGAEQLRLVGHEGAARSACFSPDGVLILTASDDHTARLWEAATGQELAALRGHEGWVTGACFSPDGAQILTASYDCTARLWDATTREELAVLGGHQDWVNSASFSADGARILTASSDQTARLWDGANGRELATLRGHTAGVRSACFSRDGARIVTACDDGSVRLWDAGAGQEIATLRGHESWAQSASFSPDSTRILSSGEAARLWDAATGQELVALHGHEGGVLSACFSGDGLRILTTSADGPVRLWDARNGEELVALRGHEAGVLSACFSRDGACILTASNDCTVRLWNARSGQWTAARRGHEKGVTSTYFSPDGASLPLATAQRDCGTPAPAGSS